MGGACSFCLQPKAERNKRKLFVCFVWGFGGFRLVGLFVKDASKLLREREGDLLHSSLTKSITGREKRLHKTSLVFLFVDITFKMFTCLIGNCHSYSGSCITMMTNAVFISDWNCFLYAQMNTDHSVHLKPWTSTRHRTLPWRYILGSLYWIHLWKHGEEFSPHCSVFRSKRFFFIGLKVGTSVVSLNLWL